MLRVPSEVLPFGSCAACRQRSISISQGGHDHLRRRHQQLFTGAVQRLGDQALLGRTHRRGAVQRLGAAQADRNPPAKARKSLSALGCKCTIRMRRAARSPKLRVCRGGGREKAFCFQFPPLQLQHLQIGTYEELQCCHTIANTPKDLMCLQSAIAAEQCSAAIAEYCLQLQEAPLQL